jgi:hypothetical protein
MEKKQAQYIIHAVMAFCEEQIDDCVKRSYHGRKWSLLGKELQYDVYFGLSKQLKIKSLQIDFNEIEANGNNTGLTTEYDKFWKM